MGNEEQAKKNYGLLPNAQCPMPHAQCPMPHSQCPMPHSLLNFCNF
ncbi:MAG: histidine kinase [Nostoc sp.]